MASKNHKFSPVELPLILRREQYQEKYINTLTVFFQAYRAEAA